MRKLISMMLLAAMVMVFAAGCGGTNTQTVGGISAEDSALLQEAGLSEEEIGAMSEEELAAIMDELGVVAEEKAQQATDASKEAPKTYTTEDVAAGGKYKVVIGDSMGWNTYTLYYEDGKLVKVEISFMKNDMEPAEEYLYEGDTIGDFWYYDMSLDELIHYFDENGYGYETRIRPME